MLVIRALGKMRPSFFIACASNFSPPEVIALTWGMAFVESGSILKNVGVAEIWVTDSPSIVFNSEFADKPNSRTIVFALNTAWKKTCNPAIWVGLYANPQMSPECFGDILTYLASDFNEWSIRLGRPVVPDENSVQIHVFSPDFMAFRNSPKEWNSGIRICFGA